MDIEQILHKAARRLRHHLFGNRKEPAGEPAFRAALFNADQLESHGMELAISHVLCTVSCRDTLLNRLRHNEKILADCCATLARDPADPSRRLSPAGVWLLDNYWLIEEQIRMARRHLPRGYSKKLPRLAEGQSAGLPRVYDLALEGIAHGDGRLDLKTLRRFIASYQHVAPLSLGELWAIPIMLRLALIENIARVAGRVMAAWNDQNIAAMWADRLIEAAGKDSANSVAVLAELAASDPPASSAFAAEFTRRLQGQGTLLAQPLQLIEEFLSGKGTGIDQQIKEDTQEQATDQVSISNSIASLRMLAAVDWQDFVEDMSLVERTLRLDPADVYGRMDFPTRDRYRHKVEKLAEKYGLSEPETAQAALDLALNASGAPSESLGGEQSAPSQNIPSGQNGGANPESHVGYFLMGKGICTLQRTLSASSGKGAIHDTVAALRKKALPGYLGAALLLAALLSSPFFTGDSLRGEPFLLRAVIALTGFWVAWQVALKLVNWLVSVLLRPYVLSAMDFSTGIPDDARTVVVIPTLAGSPEDMAALCGKLEVHFLANRDRNLRFGILSDFKDSDTETEPGDALILEAGLNGIAALNNKYPGQEGDIFFLCHRARRWNKGEGKWIGPERKRGKLCEFNKLLIGGGSDGFLLIAGNTLDTHNGPFRYVITLDTDTQLPRDAGQKLVATMAHPLNRAVYDPATQRVVSGYGIIQPRVGITIPSANRSLFSRLFSFNAGVDPYTGSVSDVYQDLFRQGSYTGKGIYDVRAFEQAVGDRFPDNSLLSHDLIEGCFARSGLTSAVVLYEEYPSGYSADVTRKHRWIRGDWQLLPWLMPFVTGQYGKREKNPLDRCSRWKIADNLRRSLYPPALLALLICGWMAPSPIFWTALVVSLLLLPSLVSAVYSLARKPPDIPAMQHMLLTTRCLAKESLETVLFLAWLPFEAFYSLDAAVRTMWRVYVSKRHLLQWNPSSDAERTSAKTVGGYYRLMAICPVAAILLLPGVSNGLSGFAAAVPFLLVWLASPAIAWRLSRPRLRKPFAPTLDQARFLKILARKTWAFFETHVTEENNWLPPDNRQEKPVAVVAHRTSPTNIGLSMLAHLSAYDFGYTGAEKLMEKLEATFATLERLEKHNGHLYNWYDTRTLEPLLPLYVSTVDSGNLAGHLLTLCQGLREMENRPVFHPGMITGLEDTLFILEEAVQKAGASKSAVQFLARDVHAVRGHFAAPGAAIESLRRVCALAGELPETIAEAGEDAVYWAGRFSAQCRDILCHYETFGFLGESANANHGPVSDGRAAMALQGEKRQAVPTYGDLAELDVASLPESQSVSGIRARDRAAEYIATAQRLAQKAAGMAYMDFSFLYDGDRRLLSIGYNVNDQRLDPSYYDLLASEARLTYYVAIAQGQIPQESWFALGRLLTSDSGLPTLLSWSGSMFEYLMPVLVMPGYEGTLLDETSKGAVHAQQRYAASHGVPWGISESGYNMRDGQHNYQYRAFGVPALGLQRGLGENLVLAPYATALALMVDPEAALLNLQALARQGLCGRYGMFEAVDYTAVRLPRGHDFEIIYSYMAHHQGMTLLSLANLLHGNAMQRRFLADPALLATRLLLEERVPESAPESLSVCRDMEMPAGSGARSEERTLRIYKAPDIANPPVQLLSNGRYHVMVSGAGGGTSRWNDLSLTRWREDTTRDNWGTFVYLRDVASGHFWSAAHQPVCRKTESYEAIFSDARAEFRVRERDYESHMEIAVSPEDDVELRRVRIRNRGREKRVIELTSYAEIVLAPPMADEQHPAFSKLFVETDIEDQLQAILTSRRPRSGDESRHYHFHMLAAHGAEVVSVSYETDRSRFVGRGRSLASPAAMDPKDEKGLLSGTQGAVLDPVAAIRCRLTLEPGQDATVDFVSGIAPTREDGIAVIDTYRDKRLCDRVFNLAWTHSQVLLHQFNATLFDAQLFEKMASSIMYANRFFRADPDVLAVNTLGQSGLWGQALSGDLPIVLVRVNDSANLDLVAQMVKAHAYWRMKGLKTDLVIWNEDHFSYRQDLHDRIVSILSLGLEGNVMDEPGGIFVRAAEQLTREEKILIQTAARLVLNDKAGTLEEQVNRRRAGTRLPAYCPHFLPQTKEAATGESKEIPGNSGTLILENGYGGFSEDGAEYVIRLDFGKNTPAPWVNVLANENFGTIVSESGSAYTWKENAHEYRLTPWGNDPVTDECEEALYIRDEDTGRYWSPTALPSRGEGSYTTRHGFGYSVFTHQEHGIRSAMTVFVPREEPVKICRLKVGNVSDRRRRLTVTGYVAWVLADLRSRSAMHIVTEFDTATGVLLAKNPYTMDFPGRVAFFASSAGERSITCDRMEFIGRNGSLASPDALRRTCLSGRFGAGLDPCAALQAPLVLEVGEEREIVFVLGAADSPEQAFTLARRFTTPAQASTALDAVTAYWKKTLGILTVHTPDPTVDVMVNGWLLYQSMASRYFGRSGYYQSGGAFGFRDQLQDTMAMVYAAPDIARRHLLLSAAHQFPEGDVQHWWHPPRDRGVRTRCSDDFLWLPLALERYLDVTGDFTILEEEVGYIEMRLLAPEEESLYDLPAQSPLRETLYDHCVRAVRNGLRFGVHGLPLMGSGDWNDGMDRVGIHGQGESVWLGFFLYRVLERFQPLALRMGDREFAETCRTEAVTLRENLNLHGWDGQWFRRAYFDDGRILGSDQSPECRIDSIAQSWSVLTGATTKERQGMAMNSLYANLVRKDIGIIQLLTPPFDNSNLDPGYIKGYVPGVRENGGQYTHAAVWAAMAFAAMGDGQKAWELAGMINPVRHGDSKEAVSVYKVEPYVLAADVYGVPPHEGRGGWTWYTGAAGWMYRLVLESLLGVRIGDGFMTVEPLLPKEWEEARIVYRRAATTYTVTVRQTAGRSGRTETTLDGTILADGRIPLADDGLEHEVLIETRLP